MDEIIVMVLVAIQAAAVITLAVVWAIAKAKKEGKL